MRVPSLAELIAGVRELCEEHPLRDLRYTLNVTGPEQRMLVYSHFVVPEHKLFLVASDQLTRHLVTRPPPQPEAQETTTTMHPLRLLLRILLQRLPLSKLY